MIMTRKLSLGILGTLIVALSACQEHSQTETDAPNQTPTQTSETQTSDTQDADNSSDMAQEDMTDDAENTDRLLMMGVESPQEVKDFLADLRDSAEDNNQDAIAGMVKYPFSTYEMGEVQKTYTSSTEFLSDYDSLITPDVLAALKSANYDSLFINQDGGSIGNGTVWINNFGNGLQIYRINK